ncbi:MAG TPA: dTMP kinase [Jiangellaceae bacterium]|nr:dTMP kinase [Jiangellaceae bacterium]
MSGTVGVFIAFEGGEGAGKSSRAHALAERLRAGGREVVLTHEPGDTRIGRHVRHLVLDPSSAGLDPWAEALLYAADRAEHVSSVIRPALDRGAVVLTDRYVDSSLAYQGVGRGLGVDAVAAVSAFATDGLVPDLTVVLDVPASLGRSRLAGPADRLEGEADVFHERVRQAFLDVAATAPQRYLVVDATLPTEHVDAVILDRVKEMGLP